MGLARTAVASSSCYFHCSIAVDVALGFVAADSADSAHFAAAAAAAEEQVLGDFDLALGPRRDQTWPWMEC
jgi:hypothetical protein